MFNSPAALRRSLRAPLALRRSTRLRSIVLPESGYSARIAWPLGRWFPRGIHRRPGYHHLAGDGSVESGVVDDIPRYHVNHLLSLDKLLRRLGDISLKNSSIPILRSLAQFFVFFFFSSFFSFSFVFFFFRN